MDEASSRGVGEQGGPGIGRLVLVAAAALVFYVLSIGPMCKLSDKGLVPDELMRVVYAPLIWGVQHSRVLEASSNWYLKTIWKSRC